MYTTHLLGLASLMVMRWMGFGREWAWHFCHRPNKRVYKIDAYFCFWANDTFIDTLHFHVNDQALDLCPNKNSIFLCYMTQRRERFTRAFSESLVKCEKEVRSRFRFEHGGCSHF